MKAIKPELDHCIELKNIDLVFDQHAVFQNLSLSFRRDRWHALLGRSGAGKSTVLKLVASLVQADSGTVSINKHAPDETSSSRNAIAYMSQDDGLLPWLTVIDNVQMGCRLRGEQTPTTRVEATELLAQVELSDWANALPSTLSGGMRQRVALARTLMEKQSIVLMDEPFSRLDAITRDELQHLAWELLSKKTVVLVTHDPVEALRMSHSVTVLQPGIPTRCDTLQMDDEPLRDPGSAAMLEQGQLLWSLLRNKPVGSAASA